MCAVLINLSASSSWLNLGHVLNLSRSLIIRMLKIQRVKNDLYYAKCNKKHIQSWDCRETAQNVIATPGWSLFHSAFLNFLQMVILLQEKNI